MCIVLTRKPQFKWIHTCLNEILYINASQFSVHHNDSRKMKKHHLHQYSIYIQSIERMMMMMMKQKKDTTTTAKKSIYC